MAKYRRRRSRMWWLLWVLPACLLCVVTVVLIAPALPGLALQVAGFESQGSVEQFWARQQTDVTAFAPDLAPPAGATLPPTVIAEVASDQSGAPTVTPVSLPPGEAAIVSPQTVNYAAWFQSVQNPEALVITLNGRRVTLPVDQLYAETVIFGLGVNGAPLGVLRFAEDALLGLCTTWLQGCATGQYEVSSVDFRSNGVLLYGQVNLAGLWQELGAAVTLAGPASLRAAGVVYNGTLYAVPETGEIADLVNNALREGNAALRDVTVQAGAYTLRVAQLSVTDEALTVILR